MKTPKIVALILCAILLCACTLRSPAPEPAVTQSSSTPAATTGESASSPEVAQATEETEAPSTTELESAQPTPSLTVPTLPTPTVGPSPTPVVLGPDKFPATINPLTGLPVNDINLLNRRPMAVKVQLYPRGQRPIYGVSLADIVFDYYHNDGLTRLNAIFYGNDASQIGPVRSARLFDENIIRMYKSIFAFAGAAEYVRDRFYNAEFADRLVAEGNNCPPMCRMDINGYNLLMTSSPELSLYMLDQGVQNDRQNLDGMSFNTQPPSGGMPGDKIETRYSISAYNRWAYDLASGKYLRFQDALEDAGGQDKAYQPLVDGLTGQQISADNVIVLVLPHQVAQDAGERDAVDIRIAGSGLAYAFRDGQAYKVRWNRPTREAMVFLSGEDGEPFPIKPGNTWFQVVGKSSIVEHDDEGAWRFKWQIP